MFIKNVYVVFVIRLFQCRKNSHLENRLSRRDNFIRCQFLINELNSKTKKVFTQNEPKFTRIEGFFDSQRISINHSHKKRKIVWKHGPYLAEF